MDPCSPSDVLAISAAYSGSALIGTSREREKESAGFRVSVSVTRARSAERVRETGGVVTLHERGDA